MANSAAIFQLVAILEASFQLVNNINERLILKNALKYSLGSLYKLEAAQAILAVSLAYVMAKEGLTRF
ncbi:hypothetical protein D1627_16930 [Pontibacter oryzae]|uniref:Uncharacterized protein n=1 Tax=Pontibacter oryzae TaxID=2304593 RepID=A0A399RQG2_9BACT|nr:hypothetical protein D1627_16930 [Pontibacter oryzae]